MNTRCRRPALDEQPRGGVVDDRIMPGKQQLDGTVQGLSQPLQLSSQILTSKQKSGRHIMQRPSVFANELLPLRIIGEQCRIPERNRNVALIDAESSSQGEADPLPRRGPDTWDQTGSQQCETIEQLWSQRRHCRRQSSAPGNSSQDNRCLRGAL